MRRLVVSDGIIGGDNRTRSKGRPKQGREGDVRSLSRKEVVVRIVLLVYASLICHLRLVRGIRRLGYASPVWCQGRCAQYNLRWIRGHLCRPVQRPLR